MPTPLHQLTLSIVYDLFKAWVGERKLGYLLFSPVPLQVAPRRYREPDLLFIAADHAHWIGAQRLAGADLVVEVVSDDRERAFIHKRGDYARLGVAEYWIVDPHDEQIHVLSLEGDNYREHGIFGRDERAHSHLLAGFSADVATVFDAGRPAADGK